MKQDRKRITDAVEIMDRSYGGSPDWDRLVAEEGLKVSVGQMVYDLRQEAGLSQAKLADLVGTSQAIISKVENADYEGSALEILSRVCFALHRNISVGRKKDGPVAVAC